MSQKLNTAIAVVGIDIGKNSFHVVGQDERGAIVLRQKWSRGQAIRVFILFDEDCGDRRADWICERSKLKPRGGCV